MPCPRRLRIGLLSPEESSRVTSSRPARMADRRHPRDPSGLTWCLRRPESPRRAHARSWRAGRSLCGADAHGQGRDRRRRRASPLSKDPARRDSIGSRCPRFLMRRNGLVVGDRHHRTPDKGRQGLLRRRPRRVLPEGGGLVHRSEPGDIAGHQCARHAVQHQHQLRNPEYRQNPPPAIRLCFGCSQVTRRSDVSIWSRPTSTRRTDVVRWNPPLATLRWGKSTLGGLNMVPPRFLAETDGVGFERRIPARN